jgi:gamma-glutamyltranspeptidase/glutathione hydrolase
MYQGNEKGAVFSGLASGVPGDLRGLEYLHNKYGVSDIVLPADFCSLLMLLKALPWRAVCNPAVHVARHGFPGE